MGNATGGKRREVILASPVSGITGDVGIGKTLFIDQRSNCLRNPCGHSELTRLKNCLARGFAMYFPENEDVYGDLKAARRRIVLQPETRNRRDEPDIEECETEGSRNEKNEDLGNSRRMGGSGSLILRG